MGNAFLGSLTDRKTTLYPLSHQGSPDRKKQTLKSPGRGLVEVIYTVLYPDRDLCLQEEGWIQTKVKALTCTSKSIINFSAESCVSGLHLLMRSLWKRI